MNLRWYFLLLLLPNCLLSQGLSYQRDSSGIAVQEDGQDVLFYQIRPKSLDGAFERAHYIHPLYAVDGSVLTEDFPEDHPHHRGVFWAWHQVLANGLPMGDAWECRDFNWELQQVALEPSGGSLLIRSTVHWTSPALKDEAGIPIPFMEEACEIRVHGQQDTYRVIDFNITLKALVTGLTLGGSRDAKGYGGFSVRMKLPDSLLFASEEGPVSPRELPVTAGNWMNISGPLGAEGRDGGLLIYAPQCGPQQGGNWILRRKESMQNAVYPGQEPVPVSPETPTVLRYRLVTYKGALSRRQIDSLQPSCTK